MATFTLCHEFIFSLGGSDIDLDSDTFKAVLTNVAPTAAGSTVLTDITQIANGNGYTTGGVTLASVTWAETGSGTGIWQWTSADFSWTASAGSIATFRYVVIYDDTSASDKLVGFLDYGSALDITVGNSFTVDVGASGIFRAS